MFDLVPLSPNRMNNGLKGISYTKKKLSSYFCPLDQAALQLHATLFFMYDLDHNRNQPMFYVFTFYLLKLTTKPKK